VYDCLRDLEMIPYRWNVISSTSIVCFLTLLLGILIGLSLSTIGKETSKISSVSGIQKEYYKELTKKVDDIEEITALQRGDLFQKEKDQNQYESDNTVSRNLYKKVRLLCWILTAGVNHGKKAAHVKATWGQRCNIILFVSGKKDASLPSVAFPVPDEKGHLWGKSREAFKYIYDKYFDQADWFYKADDDTYAIPENMRYVLSRYNTTEPLYFGAKLKKPKVKNFFSGGSGYILSKEALRRFATISLNNKTICKIKGTEGIEEDVMMAKCLNNVGVKLMDSRDEKGRERFLPFQPSDHLVPGKISLDHWYWNNVYYKAKKGEGCCSDTLISLHHLRPEDMYVFDYLLYRVRIHGIYPPRFPEGWTAPPPPDEDGKELPWIGIKEETKKKSNV
ncbi:hypothetical protein QYM36_005282, partial [Artemia franciscana]